MSLSMPGRVVLMVAICGVLAACSASTIDSRRLDYNNGLAYEHGSTTPYTGTVLFKDSIPTELVEYWSAQVATNGDYAAQNALTGCTVHYAKGVIDGDAECQGSSGKDALTVTFKNEAYDGESKLYNPQTGAPFKVIHWQNGTLNGAEQIYWMDTGKLNLSPRGGRHKAAGQAACFSFFA